MTTEQYNSLSQFADDFDRAVRDYFEEHHSLPCVDTNLSEAIQAAANMMHLIKRLPITKFIKSEENEDTF